MTNKYNPQEVTRVLFKKDTNGYVDNVYDEMSKIFDENSPEKKKAEQIISIIKAVDSYVYKNKELNNETLDYFTNIEKNIKSIYLILIEEKAKVPHMSLLDQKAIKKYLNLKKVQQILKERLQYSEDDVLKILVYLICINQIEVYNEEIVSENKNIILNYMSLNFDPIKFTEYLFSLVNFSCNKIDAVIAFTANAEKTLEMVKTESITDANALLINTMNDVQKLGKYVEQIKESIEKTNSENEEKLIGIQKSINEESIKNKKDIIKIVSMIVTIIPFLTVNLSILINTFNFSILFGVNGTLFMVLAVVIFFVGKFVDNDKKGRWVVFLIIGLGLFVLSIIAIIIAVNCPNIAEYIFPKK